MQQGQVIGSPRRTEPRCWNRLSGMHEPCAAASSSSQPGSTGCGKRDRPDLRGSRWVYSFALLEVRAISCVCAPRMRPPRRFIPGLRLTNHVRVDCRIAVLRASSSSSFRSALRSPKRAARKRSRVSYLWIHSMLSPSHRRSNMGIARK